MSISFAPMVAADALTIQRQASQRVQLGLDRDVTPDEADALAGGPGEAWTARGEDGRIVAIVGLRHTFPDVQAVAWAILAEGLGSAHLAVSRFARARIEASGLKRIEAICQAGRVIEEAGAAISNGRLLAAVLASPSPECRWARLLGLFPAHPLRNFGARSELHILFERIA